MQFNKIEQDNLTRLYVESVKGSQQAIEQAFLDAQTPGEPLKNEDGSSVEGTVYLGGPDAAYLMKKGDQLVIAQHGIINIGSDNTMPWEKYMSYGKMVVVTPEALKIAASKV